MTTWQNTLSSSFNKSNNSTAKDNNSMPKSLVFLVVAICLFPSVLNLLGFDFASTTLPAAELLRSTPATLTDNSFRYLSGALSHVILEWTAFTTAVFTVILAFAHYSIKRDVVTPIIGIALFCAGSMDAFHTLAAARLMEAVADNTDLIPFTWALCRMFNALIMIVGVAILLNRNQTTMANVKLIILVSISFGFSAYGLIHWSATSVSLPQTMYPNAIITRPFDVVPLLLFIIAGLYIYPKIYQRSPNLFTHALIISAIPEVVVELHMVFGSTALFDNHFNIAHFLKIFAYLVPFLGLCLAYIETYKEQQSTSRQLKEARNELSDYASTLEEKIALRTKQLKDKQLQLVQSEKLASVGLLAAGVAHEINNPTGFVKSNLQVLNEYNTSMQVIFRHYQEFETKIAQLNNQELNKSLQNMQKLKVEYDLDYILSDIDQLLDHSISGIHRIEKIVTDLKHYSYEENNVKSKVDINEAVIETAFRLVWNELKFKCEFTKSLSKLPLYNCCPNQLGQVIINLLMNACDSIEDNGKISISSAVKDLSIVISVKDNGSGIAENDMVHLFDPFFTTKVVGKGTGLGLSISQGIIEKHGGTLFASNNLTAGCTFTITLPLPTNA